MKEFRQDNIQILDAHENNLKHIDVTIPKGVLTAITGVAGSGKSSLARYAFVEQHPEAIVIDQKPIGTSIRSTPATYTGVMDEIRKVFAETNGVDAGWFSFNSKGACPVCKGTGQIYILDEPSTGLHGKDIEKLLALLRKLVSAGNTVVIVEHRLELIAQADWIIDMGPDGGSGGGQVIYAGTPEGILAEPRSKTGKYLKEAL